MSILDTILNIVFPMRCINCGKNGSLLCLGCLISFPEAERQSLTWIMPMYDYRNIQVKKAIGAFKYKGKKALAKIFAEIMYGRIIEELADQVILNNFKNPILIPIPLTKKRIHERGFNQSILLCKELIKIDKKNINNTNENFILALNILIKIKDVEHQALIGNRAKRLKNIIGSFSVINSQLIKGRNIILIDDVTTTGATLNEAKKTLMASGAKKIIAFTIAH